MGIVLYVHFFGYRRTGMSSLAMSFLKRFDSELLYISFGCYEVIYFSLSDGICILFSSAHSGGFNLTQNFKKVKIIFNLVILNLALDINIITSNSGKKEHFNVW